MKKTPLIAAISALLFAGCSGGGKEVLIMASGTIQLGDNAVTLEPGTRHNESTLRVTGDKITVSAPGGDREIPVPEDGLYVLNLKTDTIVGSYQRIGESNGTTRITQDVLKKRVDSLNELIVGSNVNAANRNFFLPPGQITKLTTNVDAQVIGPYLNIPGSFEAGKEHEVYKFSTNKEIREVLEKIKPLMSTDTTATQ